MYDPGTGQVFVVATQAGVRHVLYGIDPATGQIRTRRDADAPGSQPATQLQRGALLVSGATVFVAYGGNFGDCGPYLGRVVGIPTTGTNPTTTFTVPTTREGGIWAASGPATLADGSLVISTGNGEAVAGAWDHSDSVLRLSPELRLLDGFAPTGWAQENSVDADLGATGALPLPEGNRVLVAGKGGGIYLLDAGHRGGVGGSIAQDQGCPSYGGAAAAPVSGGGSVAYLPCTSGILQVRVAGDRLVRGWQAPPQISGSPIIVGRHGVVATTRRRPLRPRRRHRSRPSHHPNRRQHTLRLPRRQRQRVIPTHRRGITAVRIAP
ncbi:MAG: hypothetical protein ACR2G2_02985 [Pseudonocardia sp.]